MSELPDRPAGRAGTMLASYVLTLVDAIRQIAPHAVDAILAGAGIRAEDLARPDGRVNMPLVDRLWQGAIEHTGEPHLGLRVGAMVRPATFNLLGHVAMTAPTVGAAMAQAARLSPLVGPDGALSVENAGPLVRLVLSPQVMEWPYRAHRVEAVLAAVLVFARWAAGSPIAPRRVVFSHRRRPNDSKAGQADPYQELFAAPVVFGGKTDAIEFARETLELPIREADPTVNRLLLAQAEQRLHAQLGVDCIRYQVRQHIHALLIAGDVPRLYNIAAGLNLSPRSLQRRLQDLGCTLGDEVVAVRRELAEYYLSRADLSIEAISQKLGYSEISAFTRAFRQWTGSPPTRYRRPVEA